MLIENLNDRYREMLSKLVGTLIGNEREAEKLYNEIISSKKPNNLYD
ncbi:MAG: hypothetical protein QME45_05350 [Clostridiales bacterium]|nr:hypothetical protein [Clostridiales bacterium]